MGSVEALAQRTVLLWLDFIVLGALLIPESRVYTARRRAAVRAFANDVFLAIAIRQNGILARRLRP